MGGMRVLMGGSVAALLVIVAIPMLFVLLQAVFPEIGRGSFAAPFSGLLGTLGDPALLGLTGNTLWLGICVVAAAAALAVPLGILRALFRVPLAPLWDLLFLVPFLIPPYIAALGWIMTLQPRGYMAQLLGVDAGGLLFSFTGIVFVMVLNVFPVVYFAVSRTMAAVGSRFADVGRVCGASPLRSFWRITLPLSTPGVAASLLLVFAMAIEEFGTPAALGSRVGFHVLVTGIERRLADWPIDLPGAATLSLVLVGLAIAAFLLQQWVVTRRSFVTVSGKPAPLALRSLGVWRVPVLAGFALTALLGTVLPLFAILATAVSATLSGGLAAENLSLVHFRAVIADRGGALTALGNSLDLGLATAALTGLLGAAVAYCLVRTRLRGRQVLDALAMLPNTIPGVVVAVGLILAWNHPVWPVTPYNTAGILLLAYCCLLLPYPIRYAGAAFRQIGDSVEAAARVCGAPALTTFRRVLLPLLAPSLIAAMLLVFAVASRELVASILVAPVGFRTVSIVVWRQFEQGSVGLGMAMAAISVTITTGILLAVTLWTRRLGPAN